MITTHYIQLCETLDTNKAIVNKHMETLIHDKKYTYTYKLKPSISTIKGGVKVLRDLWFNINYNKDYNVSHNHFGNNNKFSGVYYVKAPKNCGHIVLEHPANLVELSWAEKVPKGQHNEYTGSIWTYNPLPGKLLIFPSWLDHRVEPNLSKSPRVSFSFNIE